jgi:hypothetical protein
MCAFSCSQVEKKSPAQLFAHRESNPELPPSLRLAGLRIEAVFSTQCAISLHTTGPVHACTFFRQILKCAAPVACAFARQILQVFVCTDSESRTTSVTVNQRDKLCDVPFLVTSEPLQCVFSCSQVDGKKMFRSNLIRTQGVDPKLPPTLRPPMEATCKERGGVPYTMSDFLSTSEL